MNPLDDPLRRVAILVATLDTINADALLEQLSADDAARVRQMMVDIVHVDADEEQLVIGDFLRSGQNDAVRGAAAADFGVELHLSAASTDVDSDALDRSSDSAGMKSRSDGGGSPTFEFLHHAECDSLLELLSAERPQTIALVLSRLPEVRALQVVAALPEPVQVDVLRRWVDLDEADPSVLREIEQQLQARIVECFGAVRRRPVGRAQIAGVLQAADDHTKRHLLTALSKVDPTLVEMAVEPRLDFADVEYFDDAALMALLPTIDEQLLAYALAGATESLVERVQRQMSVGEAKKLRKAIDSLAPVRLSDIEAAQREVARAAERLLYYHEGEVHSRPLIASG